MANNLAKLSILATVALAGYDMKLLLDPTDPLNSAIKSQNPTTKPAVTNSPQGSQKLAMGPSFQSTNAQASGYTTNATNIIQNSMHLVQSHKEKTSFKSYVDINEKNGDASANEPRSENVLVEKENTASKKKFAISGNAKNVVVKRILDNLLTQFISSKLALDGENEVNDAWNVFVCWSRTHNGIFLSTLPGSEVVNFEHPKSVSDLGQRYESSAGRFPGVPENKEF